jgi:hypothetical protein
MIYYLAYCNKGGIIGEMEKEIYNKKFYYIFYNIYYLEIIEGY